MLRVSPAFAVRTLALTKKGLRLFLFALTLGKGSPNARPDEEGIETNRTARIAILVVSERSP